MKVLFATTNPAKVNKYKEALEQKGIELITLKDLDVKLTIVESGKNAIENAYIKAKTYYDATKIPTIGMDNNLFIEDLPKEKQPGTYVRRVNGKELNDEEMIEHYTKLVKENGGNLKAKWVYGMVIYKDDIAYKYTWSKENFYFVDTPSEKINNGYEKNYYSHRRTLLLRKEHYGQELGARSGIYICRYGSHVSRGHTLCPARRND